MANQAINSDYDGIGQVVATRKGRTRSSKRTDAADRRRSLMPAFRDRLWVLSATIIVFAATGTGAIAQKKYDTGATDTEIKIGNIMPYSGPASAYGVIGKTEVAYFKKINAEGGINGRKIKFISYDDAYSPPKTV